ncbi:unnamed protein product [Clavelina lepadiformis]|uniref:Uncharacterized protein n=1 Tax=Clavelina lepadiformis TaxID=159417 RepID=A0ABP0FHH1_CLALP
MEDLFIHVKYSGVSFAAFVMLKYWVKRKGLIAKSVRQERTALWYNLEFLARREFIESTASSTSSLIFSFDLDPSLG